MLQGFSGKESTCQCRRQETQVQSLAWKDPLEKEMATTPVYLPGESHGQRCLEGCGPQGHRESDMPSDQTTSVMGH